MLQFLHHFETHTLLFSIRFHHVPCTFTHTLLQPGSHRLHFFLKNLRGTVPKASEICCSFHQVFLPEISRIPVWPNLSKTNHMD